ncbi:glycoside hydrolase family 3 protein, partial [Aliarcobacter butzleri]
DKNQLKNLITHLQAISNQKLLISIDQEGGVEQRLKKDSGFVDTLSAKDIATNGEDYAKQRCIALAKYLKVVVINLDFVPV